MSKAKFRTFKGAHERKKTKLTIINILLVVFLRAILLILIKGESEVDGGVIAVMILE